MPKSCSPIATDALRRISARTIVGAIADAAERWCDADFPPRVRATGAVAERLGYTVPVIEYALDRLFGGITARTLEATIRAELGSLEALDGFVACEGRPSAWARGVERVTIVASDSTIGVAIPALAFALCAKCRVTVKERSDALVAAFASTLAEELPELQAALDVRSWSGGDDAVEARAIGAADVVVAFGGDAALCAIRARCATEATFVPFGHRASAGYIARDALADPYAAAAGVARDALLYDGDGCLSLHLLFVEGSAAERGHFVHALRAALAATAIEFPPGHRDAARAARGAGYVATAAFRAAGGHGGVARAADGAWAIVLDPPHDELPPFGGGVLPVVAVDGIAAAAAYVAHHRLPLQAVGIAGSVDPVALAEQLGAVRITAVGTMQDPPLAGHHGGRARIADFVRWIDRA